MKINEIRDLSAADLDKKLAELKEELFNLRFKIREVKKSIARIKTVQRQNEINA